MMRENAKAFEKWDSFDSKIREPIERECAKARWHSIPRVYDSCVRCRGSGKLVPEVEAGLERAERLAAFFYATRGWTLPKSF